MNIAGLTVSYNGKGILHRALESIKKFYDIKILVIDGSDKDCSYKYVKTLDNKVQFGYNIGHGRGLNIGITLLDTDYIMIFDTDIEMLKPPLEKMIGMFDEDTFGVGEIHKVSPRLWGVDIKENISYLHPYFQVISKREYLKYMPYVHNGAPAVLTMLDIYEKKVEVIKEFPVKGYIKHPWRGTRDLYSDAGIAGLFKDQTKAQIYFSKS